MKKIQTMEKLLFFAFSIALHQKNYRFNLCLLQNKDLIKVRIAGSKNLIASTQKQPPELFYDRWYSYKFCKIHSKHLCQSLFLIKFKNETLAQVSLYEFCEISKNIFYAKHLWAIASVNSIFYIISLKPQKSFYSDYICAKHWDNLPNLI